MLEHPYPEGTRVRHAGDDSVGARAAGTARILEPVTGRHGDLEYKVRTDTGGEGTWPAYYTIPIGEAPFGRNAPDHGAA